MPQTPTANMALIQPTENGDDDVWDVLLTTLFGLVDAHDHTSGKGVKVPSAGLKINADVSWSFGGSSYAISDLRALDFTTVAAASVSALADAWFVSSVDNELYWRNHSGTNIKVTSGSTLNVAGFVGGIGGDYSAISALLDYDDATDTYRFRQETAAAVRQFAKISCADVIIREYDAAGDATVPAETVTLKSPDALAGSYALTFPGALPGATTLRQVTSAGIETFTNTIVEDVTLAAGKNVTFSTTGRVIHGTYVFTQFLHFALYASAGTVSQTGASPGGQVAANTIAYVPLLINEHHKRIISVEVTSMTSVNNTTYALVLADTSGTFSADIAGTTTTTDQESAILTPTTPAVISDGLTIWIKVWTAAGTTRQPIAAIVSYAMD